MVFSGLLYLGYLFLLLAPSAAIWRSLRALDPRVGSLADRAKRNARTRLILVAITALLQLALVAEFSTQPGYEAPTSGHQFGPRMEAWRQGAMALAQLGTLTLLGVLLGLFVVFCSELGLFVDVVRARRWAKTAEPATPQGEPPARFDVGLGDVWMVKRGEVVAGYREHGATEAWARGVPTHACLSGGVRTTLLTMALVVPVFFATAMLMIGE